MKIFPANNSASMIHYLAGRYPDSLGHLYSPGGQRGPYEWLPYALDNGRFVAWSKGETWNEPAYFKLLDWATEAGFRGYKPLWVLVPDVVANRADTLKEWERWYPTVHAYGFPLAFAVQDGMTPQDVPNEADVIFVGGSTAWKWNTLPTWTQSFPRVHCGRVNGWRGLRLCKQYGIESCDGTGWMRGDKAQLGGLLRFLAQQGEVIACP